MARARAGSSTRPAPRPCMAAAERYATRERPPRRHRGRRPLAASSSRCAARRARRSRARAWPWTRRARRRSSCARAASSRSRSSSGRLGALALHGARALTGGIPLNVGGEVVGAIGTSGETPDEDEAVSVAGAARGVLHREVPALTYDEARTVAEAAAAAATARGVAPGRRGRRRRRRPRLPVAARRRAGRERRRRHRQGPHGGDLPPPSKDFEDQASNGRAFGAAPGACGPPAGRHPDRPRRRGGRRHRRQRRLVRRRGPGARAARRRGGLTLMEGRSVKSQRRMPAAGAGILVG